MQKADKQEWIQEQDNGQNWALCKEEAVNGSVVETKTCII